MKKAVNISITLVVNILLVGLLLYVWMVTCFRLGWADTGDHSAETNELYFGFMTLHLALSLLIITRPKKNSLFAVIASCLFILILYGLVFRYTDEISGYIDKHFNSVITIQNISFAPV